MKSSATDVAGLRGELASVTT